MRPHSTASCCSGVARFGPTGAIISIMSTPGLIRRRIYVSGLVQGVMFRESCRRVAAQDNVAGYARNLPDGRVEVLLEGEPDSVQKLLNWCRTGPPSARVDSVEVLDEEPRGERGFVVR